MNREIKKTIVVTLLIAVTSISLVCLSNYHLDWQFKRMVESTVKATAKPSITQVGNEKGDLRAAPGTNDRK